MPPSTASASNPATMRGSGSTLSPGAAGASAASSPSSPATPRPGSSPAAPSASRTGATGSFAASRSAAPAPVHSRARSSSTAASPFVPASTGSRPSASPFSPSDGGLGSGFPSALPRPTGNGAGSPSPTSDASSEGPSSRTGGSPASPVPATSVRSPARWTPRPARRTLRSTDDHQKHHRRFRRIPPLGTTPSRRAVQGPPRPPDPPHGQRPLSHPRPPSSRWPGTLPCPKPVPKGRQGQCQRRNQNPESPADATRQLPARIRYRRRGETGFPVGQGQRNPHPAAMAGKDVARPPPTPHP